MKQREKIKNIIRGYPDGETFFVEQLAQGVAMICAAFHPKPVILR
jgi:pyruvate,water dikinase